MVRNRKKKALYEVIGKSRFKSGYGKTLEPLHTPKPDTQQPTANSDMLIPPSVPKWPKRLRIVQFNAGRVEVSMPYQLAIALFLGGVLLVLVVFRLGQSSYRQKITGQDAATSENLVQGTRQPGAFSQKTDTGGRISLNTQKVKPTMGDHRIVITQYRTARDLRPVQKYFAENSIETVIKNRGGRFFLLSKNTYESTQRRGSDGYAAKKRIIKVGAGYKAPQGYESFVPNLFSDAYGEKIK